MPAWRDRIRPGSWRGVQFAADAVGVTAGRRAVVHEMPQRDLPIVEDLGRAARRITIDAYVHGESYMDERDALLEACEEAGPGTLVHPYRGSITVRLVEVAELEETTAEGGVARLRLVFVEASEPAAPASAAEQGAGVAASSSSVLAAHAARFAEAWDTASDAVFVSVEAAESIAARAVQLRAAIESPRAALLRTSARLFAAVETIAASASALASSPEAYAAALSGVWAAALAAGEDIGQSGAALPLLRSLLTDDAAAALSAQAVHDTEAEQQVAANARAEATLYLAQVVAYAALAASDYELEDVGAAEALRDDLTGACSALIEASEDDPSELVALRSAIARDIDRRAIDLPRLVEHVPEWATSTTLVAHDLYGDATREAEIRRRNIYLVPHPLFVGPVALRVLST